MTDTNIRRQLAPDSARKIAADLTRHGVAVPSDAADVLARLDALDAARPAAPEWDDLIDAFVTGAKNTTELSTARIIATDLTNAHAEARIRVAQRALQAFTANGDALTLDLRKVAEPLIAKVTDAARLDSLEVADLIRSGRTADADAAAHYEMHAADLAALYALRDRVTRGADYMGCGLWKDPRPVTAANELHTTPKTPAEAYRRGIRAGGELWFPTPAEAQTEGARIATETKQAADAAQIENRRHSVVAFNV